MAKIRVEGIDDLQKAIKDRLNLDDVKRVVKHNGAELQRKIQENADFTQGYQTGTTKRSVGLEMKDGGFTAEAGPKTEYSQYLEFGTRFMNAQPFVKPAYDEQKEQFEADMKKLTK